MVASVPVGRHRLHMKSGGDGVSPAGLADPPPWCPAPAGSVATPPGSWAFPSLRHEQGSQAIGFPARVLGPGVLHPLRRVWANPDRIQLRRTKGWRKSAAAVVVARPSRWGNPHRVGIDGDRLWCFDRFREDLWRGGLPFSVDDVHRELAGRDLACWCRPEDLCHADVLLEVANGR